MLRFFSTVVCALELANNAVATQQNIKRASSSKTTSTGPLITSLSSTAGPFLAAYSYTWSQYITPTIVGTVQVTVNEATNQTYSTTVYHSEFATNGSMSLLTRTDTNSLGTVTASVNDINGGYATLVYPTNYFDPYSEMTWSAWWPISTAGEQSGLGAFVSTLGKDGTCCLWSSTYSKTPAHTPFVADVSPTNTADPSGWLYTLLGAHIGDPYEVLGSTQISSLWAPTSLGIVYNGCPHTSCIAQSSSAAPASAVQSVGNLLATSTTTISSASSTSTTPKAKTSPTTSTTATALPVQKSSTPSETPTTSSTPTQSSTSAPASSPPSSKTENTSPQPTTSAPQPTPHTTAPTTSYSTTLTQAPILTVGTHAITQNSASLYIISSQTLAPGSTITLGSGSSTTIIALHTSGSRTILAIGTSSSVLANAESLVPVSNIGSTTVATTSESEVVIAGQTLVPGSEIVVSGTTITDIGGYVWMGLGSTSNAASTSGSGSRTTTGDGLSATSSPLGSSSAPAAQSTSGSEMIQKPIWLEGGLFAVGVFVVVFL